MTKADIPALEERIAFEAWASAEWQNSNPPHNAWLGWQARAALSRTPGEAVAWRFKHKHVRDDRWRFNDKPPEGEPWTEGEPLYAHPAPAAPAGEIEALSEWGRKVLGEIAGQPGGALRFDPWNWTLQQLLSAGLVDKRDGDEFASYRYSVTPKGSAALASPAPGASETGVET